MSDDLFAALTSTGAMRAAVAGPAWLHAMLDAEVALAEAAAAVGLVDAASARAVRAAALGDDFDLPAIAEAAVDGGNPVIPLVAELRARVPESAADAVHIGATSQDILDTALVLVVRRAWSVLDGHLTEACGAAAELAATHRTTLMAARTLLQQALPTTFGLKAAGWLVALVEAGQALVDLCERRLAGQLGGAAGTLAAFGDRGLEVTAAFAAALGLPEPVLPWHTARGRIGELAGALGVVAGVCDKIALDVGLLAQTEVGEVREARAEGRGGSSTLPHKRNPVGVAGVRAAALRARGQVSVLLAAMAQEHERALGAWPAEWTAVTDVLVAVDAGVAGVADVLGGLEVDADRMAANLELTHGLILAEAVVGALAPTLGGRRARDVVEGAARRALDRSVPFLDELVQAVDVAAVLDEASIDRLLDPAGYLGSTDALIDRALAVWKETNL
ncbi:MAG: class-II fumarase/aspartase family protein [Acidimicrobiales bacterium]